MAQKKGDKPPMRKITISLPEDLVRRLKLRTFEELTTIGKIVERAIERELEKGGGKAKR